MKRIPVNSSNLVSIGYDEKQQLLEIEFKRGGIYHYTPVSPQLFAQLQAAPSHGEFFHANIRNDKSLNVVKVKGND